MLENMDMTLPDRNECPIAYFRAEANLVKRKGCWLKAELQKRAAEMGNFWSDFSPAIRSIETLGRVTLERLATSEDQLAETQALKAFSAPARPAPSASRLLHLVDDLAATTTWISQTTDSLRAVEAQLAKVDEGLGQFMTDAGE